VTWDNTELRGFASLDNVPGVPATLRAEPLIESDDTVRLLAVAQADPHGMWVTAQVLVMTAD
jgi:hypothetical protein